MLACADSSSATENLLCRCHGWRGPPVRAGQVFRYWQASSRRWGPHGQRFQGMALLSGVQTFLESSRNLPQFTWSPNDPTAAKQLSIEASSIAAVKVKPNDLRRPKYINLLQPCLISAPQVSAASSASPFLKLCTSPDPKAPGFVLEFQSSADRDSCSVLVRNRRHVLLDLAYLSQYLKGHSKAFKIVTRVLVTYFIHISIFHTSLEHMTTLLVARN